MPAPFTPPAIALDPGGTYIQTNTRNVPVIRRRKPRRTLYFNRLYAGLQTPGFGFPSVVQSNRSYLAGCSRYWRTVLTAPERAAWTALSAPWPTGFQKYMAWQKANEGLKMVNPRIDLWDLIPPYPLAPASYSPPTIGVSDTHLWLTAPGGDASYLQGKVSTDPPTQYVQVSVKPFRRSITATKPNNMNTNYHLVQVPLGSSFDYTVDPSVGGGGCPQITFWTPFGDTSLFSMTFEITFSTAHSIVTWPAASSADLTIVSTPLTSPAGSAETISSTIDFTFTPQSLFAVTITPSASWVSGTASGSRYLTSKGNFTNCAVNVNLIWCIYRSVDAVSDLWGFPFHTMGAPHDHFYTYVRLMAVDILTGSPGDTSFFLAAPE